MKVNKLLLVEGINEIKDGNYEIICQNNSVINVEGKTYLINKDKSNYNLKIMLKDYSSLIFNKVNVVSKDIDFNIEINSNSRLELNWLIINDGNNKITLNVIMKGNKSYCKLKLRVLNKDDGYANVICNGIILENTCDNELVEDLKGLITSHDNIKISPNMEVLTNEVLANHLVTVGSFREEELFYLTSKGLSLNTAKKLLVESFMNQVQIDENLIDNIKTEVITIE